MRNYTSTVRLRLLLGLFFLALSLPTVILVRQAYSQLKWESFHQYRNLAQELSARINNRFSELISAEESRGFADYSFLVVSGTPESSYLQPSPLSDFPVQSAIPGLLGYFQLDAQGHFSTPLLPQVASQAIPYGVSSAQLPRRQQLQRQIQRILADNQLAQPRPSLEQEAPEPTVSASAGEALASVAQVLADRVSGISRDEFDREEGAALEEIALAGSTAAGSTAAGSTAAGSTAVDDMAADAAARSSAPKVFRDDSPSSFERLKAEQQPQKQQEKLDALSDFGRVADLNLESNYDERRRQAAAYPVESKKRAVRKEQSALPIVQAPPGPLTADSDGATASGTDAAQVVITLFESEIDPFDFALLDSGHFVLYRNVWRGGERTIQGAIVAQQPFLQGAIEPLFRETGLSQMSDLAVAYQGSVFAAFGGVSGRGYLSRDQAPGPGGSGGELLYQSRLSAPFGDLELLYSINRLPVGQGATVIGWAALVLAIVLIGGLLLMHHLGLRQIALGRQQQDFVSAVSHELKTPLTSIRMYSEMLREGWVDPQKRKRYYDFIFDESERLSRLIANVLQLSRVNRNDIRVDLKPLAVHTLFDAIASKLSSQIESAGFNMTLDIEERAREAVVAVDLDCFTQILINLVDNAIKFSAKANNRAVDISARLCGTDEVVICVRDYGPGVPRNQMKTIFRLFYRSETELTRETVGTGIGLALVQQQVHAMGGKVDVVNRNPGAEFSVTLKRA